MDGAVGVEVRRRLGVAGNGGNEMDMTTDSEEDSKFHTSVWASGRDGGLSGNPGAAAVANWERSRVEATTDGGP